ncbi:GGDEF domain-containing protein [Piscinibacter koreensis]|uniref:diguanylate cyclase n=1 Tax=Piscinibacter koreensis TaxID=2742824 RepID=A0A7Y6TYJ2_9BURK|nr:GGDEF domain-containing protein [Schlegelella koreensis]NUZ08162.1 GGDEF domain-containing protein [Schlegelella koreensis]
MEVHLPTLLLACAAALALAAGVTTFVAARQRSYRGTWWWVGAAWLLVPGLVLAAVGETLPPAQTAAAALALAWPIVVLAGMRRFFSRRSPGLPALVDWLLLGAAWVVGAVSAAFGADGAPRPGVVAGAGIALNVYASVLLTRLEDFNISTALKSLVAAVLIGAGAQAMWLAYTATAVGVTPAATATVLLLATVASALLMTYLGVLLNHERKVEDLHGSLRKLRHIADVDALTRLPNRRHFHELAQAALAERGDAAASVVVFDVDCLKHINDVLGASNGDEALRQVGVALRETLRRRDIAGRLGGDDFAALLLKTSADEARRAAARVMTRLDDRQIAPRIARVSLNIGIAQLEPGETLAGALLRAEAELAQSRDVARLAAAAAAPRPAVAVDLAIEPMLGGDNVLA